MTMEREHNHTRISQDLWSNEDHQHQDQLVIQHLNGEPDAYSAHDQSDMLVVLQSVAKVASEGKHLHLIRVQNPAALLRALRQDSELLKLVGQSHANRSYRAIRCLELFRAEPVPKSSTQSTDGTYDTDAQKKAVAKSWERQFVGEAAQALWNYIVGNYNRQDSRFYAHYTAIVQSSGMGKSRTVDELAKNHFVIPINLRGPNTTGYPPPDEQVREFLVASTSKAVAYDRSRHFLEALFEHTTAKIREEYGDVDKAKIPSQFRSRMTDGQTFQQPNAFRTSFYNEVIRNAKLACNPLESTSPADQGEEDGFPPARACEVLANLLQTGGQGPSLSKTSQKNIPSQKKILEHAESGGDPLIVLAFDEAHMLTERKDAHSTPWSYFSELRRVLRDLNHQSCFSLFMSTTEKISQFISFPAEDSSSRLHSRELILIQPFTDVGFDTLATQVSVNGEWDLNRLTTDSHMSHLGRPLFGSLYDAGFENVREELVMFAAKKLLNRDPVHISYEDLTDDQRIACLSQRIPLEFKSTTYIAQASERKQVEGHMRVCLKIDPTFESMTTVSASEPLLSEAAYGIMARTSFNAPKAMKRVVEGFSIDQGDRGEFIIMLLLTIARDQTVGPPASGTFIPAGSRVFSVAQFLAKSLFGNNSTLELLRQDFPNGKMHFNHYVKVHQFKAIDAESLLLLSSRGAAVLCATNQRAIDGINPFLCNGPSLELGNLGLILWQGKNDSGFTDTVEHGLFESMNAYKLKILREEDQAVPLIKIVFALASKTPSLSVERRPPSSDYNAVVYEIWCAGMAHDFLSVVEKAQEDVWAALLQATYGWESIYKGDGVNKHLRRSMNPGAADATGHWRQWAKRSDNK